MCPTHVVSILWILFSFAEGRGLLLLYRPKDVSKDCAFSEHLRYDVSFGMGMSDTITLVFRTMSEIDYECTVEIVTESSKNIYLLVVIRFPNNIGYNCLLNPDTFTVLKKADCLRLCDQVGSRDIYSPYFVISVVGRLRFRFISNSSLNSDMDADFYEVTATSARLKGNKSCDRLSETICITGEQEFCFTSGVVCDGIKNCGVNDWFDERKSECELPDQHLGYTPVIAVAAAILCALLAAIHILLQCLPPLANSFFIFNANEDNRLCIDPVLKPHDTSNSDTERTKRASLIPVSSSSSGETSVEYRPSDAVAAQELRQSNISGTTAVGTSTDDEKFARRKTTMRSMTAKLHERLKSVTNRARTASRYGHDEPPTQFDV